MEKYINICIFNTQYLIQLAFVAKGQNFEKYHTTEKYLIPLYYLKESG